MTNAPNPHRLRHAEAIEPPRIDATAFRAGWRITTRLDGLLADGSITRDQWQAASEYRDAWDALRRTSGGMGSISLGLASHGDGRASRLDRIGRIRAAERSIGPMHTALCRACVVEDASWHALGQRLGVRNVTARAWTIDAVRALATAWRDGWTAPGPLNHSRRPHDAA